MLTLLASLELATDGEMSDALTKREMEILALIAQGTSNQELAERLVLSRHTVRNHIANIFQKLGVTARAEAVAQARVLGLVGAPPVRK